MSVANVETILLTTGLQFVSEALASETPVNITAFHIGSGIAFAADPLAADVLPSNIYSGKSSQVTTARDSDDNLVYTILLGETVGPFDVGNVMVFASTTDGSNPLPFIHLILPFTTPKTVTVGPSPGNTLAIRITVNVSDGSVSANVTVNILNEVLGVLPSTNTNLTLPAPGPSAFPHYVVQEVDGTLGPAIAMRKSSDNTWWGNGFVQRLDDSRFGWAWGGRYTDLYTIPTKPTVFGGFVETTAPKFFATIDGGAAWAVATATLDGGTW